MIVPTKYGSRSPVTAAKSLNTAVTPADVRLDPGPRDHVVAQPVDEFVGLDGLRRGGGHDLDDGDPSSRAGSGATCATLLGRTDARREVRGVGAAGDDDLERAAETGPEALREEVVGPPRGRRLPLWLPWSVAPRAQREHRDREDQHDDDGRRADGPRPLLDERRPARRETARLRRLGAVRGQPAALAAAEDARPEHPEGGRAAA